jgi:small subunit ribosomal protein S20
MPTRKSGLKHMRADEKKRQRNARVKSSLKTLTRKYETLVAKGDKEGAAKIFPSVASAMDKAAKKGIIHDNRAARQKSRLARKLA